MQSQFTPAQAERFWSHVDKSGDCWLWTGATNVHGYGNCMVARRHWIAHRVSYIRGVGFSAANALKTECPNGHPYSGANLITGPGGRRRCRICNTEQQRAYEASHPDRTKPWRKERQLNAS